MGAVYKTDFPIAFLPEEGQITLDKYEYKVRSEEIKTLIAEGAYAEAAEIADTIDWRRVKSVMMLCTVSDLYKVNRRYEDAKNMLLLAYEKKPGGRTICYSLCELCIKTEEFVQAVSYYNEFMRVAPKDPERYILQYKLYEAQNVNLEERIGVLEELKKRDYREKWAYELAYLYHRVGLATRCVEECDELILWFGEGKYVIKAMELKMLHQPLSFAQQEAYDHRYDEYVEETAEQYTEETDAQYYDGQYLYEGRQEAVPPFRQDGDIPEDTWEAQNAGGETAPEEMDIQVKTMDVGKYNTINLQEELAAGLQEVLGAEETGIYGGNAGEEAFPNDAEMEGTEIFFGETGEIEEAALAAVGKGTVFEDAKQAGAAQAAAFPNGAGDDGENAVRQNPAYSGADAAAERADTPEKKRETGAEQPSGSTEAVASASEDTSVAVMDQMRKETMEKQAQLPGELADVLLQETDGQISMVLPERAAVERQITGQMKIDDILAEWERMKKANEEKCREEVRQHVLRQTGPMFTEFEAAVRDGLLEQLEGTSQERSSAANTKGTTGAAAVLAGVKAAEELVPPEKRAGDQTAVQHTATSGYGEAGRDRMNADYAEAPGSAERAGMSEQENSGYGKAPAWNNRQKGLDHAEESRDMEGEAVSYYGEEPAWTDGRGGMEYVEENGNMEESSWQGFGGGEASEWEGVQEGQEDPNREYAEAAEWEDGQEDPNREYAEAAEWEDVQEDPNREYAEAAEWEDGQEDPNREYAEAPEWEDGVIPEEAGWSQGGADYMEVPEYGEEAEIHRGADRLTGYAEAAEYIEDEGETNYRNELSYAETPGSGKEEAADSMDRDVRKMPEYVEKMELPEDDVIDEGDEKSEAVDYLEALEHVEEEEDENEAALDPDGFEMIGSEEEGAREDSKAGKEKKAGAVKGSGSKQKENRSVPERERAKVRSLTREEKELFAPFIQNRQSREQLVKALDGISMAAYTGNVVITGEEGMDTLTLAKNMIREVRMTDSNFSGKVAKITGVGMNRKNVRETLEEFHNGALIIQKASGMDNNTAGMLHISLQQEKFGIIVIMEDTRKAIQKLFLGTPQLFGDFTARVDLEALSNDTLVSFGRRYAREKEYSIDDLGMLALHTRIEESQTIDHVVTVIEVKQIVDDAIRRANRKTIGHFFDILLARRYDDEDMIILTEKDFVA
ncbi:MAG: hypothetical protein HFH84_04260 [Lachnospiraceae bacterium]|nr:hypothetical protein [Lachnospiraceae bacterium]